MRHLLGGRRFGGDLDAAPEQAGGFGDGIALAVFVLEIKYNLSGRSKFAEANSLLHYRICLLRYMLIHELKRFANPIHSYFAGYFLLISGPTGRKLIGTNLLTQKVVEAALPGLSQLLLRRFGGDPRICGEKNIKHSVEPQKLGKNGKCITWFLSNCIYEQAALWLSRGRNGNRSRTCPQNLESNAGKREPRQRQGSDARASKRRPCRS